MKKETIADKFAKKAFYSDAIQKKLAGSYAGVWADFGTGFL